MQQTVSNDSTCLEQIAIRSEDAYWTTAEAAIHLGRSERTIRRLLQSGALDGHKVSGSNGMVWKVKPIDKLENGTEAGAIDELNAEYHAREDQIDLLVSRVKELEEQLTDIELLYTRLQDLEVQLEETNALYENALKSLRAQERRGSTSETREELKHNENKNSWWSVFRLPSALKTANVTELR